MSNLIECFHPYQIKNLNSIKEYLFLLKNILRIISTSKFKEKIKGINIPIRWSTKHFRWVVDFGSDKLRDIEGIHLDNLRFYYDKESEVFNSIVCVLNKIQNCKNMNDFGSTYKLFKNENRFLNFVFKENKIFLTGLYNRCQTKKRCGIYSSKNLKSIEIDTSENFLNLAADKLMFLEQQNFYKINFSYRKSYEEFFKIIEKEELEFKVSNNEFKYYLIKDYYNVQNKIKKYEIKKYMNAIEKTSLFNEKDIFQFLILHITLMFNHFILKNLNSNKLDDIIFKDFDSGKNIKIVSKFNTEPVFIKEKILKTPLLPMSF